jgi:hypothetical protein
MLDQDNVPIEKVSLTGSDFMEDPDSFGIQDTQILANRDLNSFLLNDPDDIKDLKDEKTNEDPKPQPKKEEFQEPKKNPPKKEEEKPDGKEALDNFLFDDESKSKDKTKTEIQDPKEAPESADDEIYTTLSRDFLRLGVFNKISEEETEETIDIKTPEQFLERFNLEKKRGAINILDNFLSQFGDDRRKMFDAIFVNGVEPKDYLQSFSKIETIGNLDLSSEDSQERIVRAYYKGLKWDETKIETRIQKLKDYGDLEDEAKTYQEVLLNKEKEVAAELEQKKIKEAQDTKDKEIATKKSYQRILNEKLKSNDFDGIPLTQREIEDTISYMSDKRYKLESGELLSEYEKDLLELSRPENHELKVKLGLLLRKKLDLSSIKKTTISKKSDALFTLSTKNAKQNSKEKEIKSFF